MLPNDLPNVALPGTPTRFQCADMPAAQRGYWEWLRVELSGGGEIAVFDPDHLCPPGLFGRPCHLGIEIFHPQLAPNPEHRRGLAPTTPHAEPDCTPIAAGRVYAHHRQTWRYTGPVTSWEGHGETRRPVVRHVIDAAQITLRLVIDLGGETLLAQLSDPETAPPVGTWVTLRAGRPELVAIEARVPSEE